MQMYCEKYKCTLSETACLARHQKMVRPGPVKYERDPGCVGCEIGKELLKRYRKGELMKAKTAQTKPGSITELKGATEEKTKACRICGEQKPLKAFYINKAAKDGREGLCKDCKRVKSRERRRKPERKDTIKKNDHDVDEMVRQIFEQAGHANLYDALEKRAFTEFRTPALQLIAIVHGSV